MSSYILQPNINTWQSSLYPINTTFISYDSNGKRINGKQFYMVYSITYDGSTPDLSTGTTVFPNKDGIIEFPITNTRCRISIDLYMVPIFNEYLDLDDMADDYICKHVCDNLLLPFEPYIETFDVTYTSSDAIVVGNRIPRKYIQVTTYSTDGTLLKFTLNQNIYNDYIVTPNVVDHINENIIKVSYYDSVLEKTWERNIIVFGKVKIAKLYASYLGERKQLNNIVLKTEISVRMEIFDGYTSTIVPVSRDQWEFTTFPQITNLNDGRFEITYNDVTCEIFVPYYHITYRWYIDAWYEGYPVKVGNKFIPEDFRIYLYKASGLRELIPLDHCNLVPSDYTIHNTGINWYTVIYRAGTYTLKDKVAIMGYEEIERSDEDFSMFYFDKGFRTYIDVTDMFSETCTMSSIRYFNWSKILNRIKGLGLYGIYKLYAPVLTGLSTLWDTEWIIHCDSKKGIRSELIKNYIKEKREEINDGEDI